MSKTNFRLVAIVALIVAAVLAVFFLAKREPAKKTLKAAFSLPAIKPAMAEADYEQAALAAFSDFKINDAGIAESVLNRLAALAHIPGTEQGAHFALVSKLTLYDRALRTGSGADQALKDLVATRAAYPWLKSVAPFSAQ